MTDPYLWLQEAPRHDTYLLKDGTRHAIHTDTVIAFITAHSGL